MPPSSADATPKGQEAQVDDAAVDAGVQRLLVGADLGGAMIDPSSMKALQDLVRQRKAAAAAAAETRMDDVTTSAEEGAVEGAVQRDIPNEERKMPPFSDALSSTTPPSMPVPQLQPPPAKEAPTREAPDPPAVATDPFVAYDPPTPPPAYIPKTASSAAVATGPTNVLPSQASAHASANPSASPSASVSNVGVDANARPNNHGNSEFEDRIMQHMEYQTKLILDLHQRINDLQQQVQAPPAQDPSRTYVESTTTRVFRTDQDPHAHPLQQRMEPMRALIPPQLRALVHDPGAMQAQMQAQANAMGPNARGMPQNQEQQQQQQQQQQQEDAVPREPIWKRLGDTILNLPLVQLTYVFWKYCVPPHIRLVDAGLIFKAFFMAVVMSNRLASKFHHYDDNNNGDPNKLTAHQMQLLAGCTFIFLGVFFHLGYIAYVYRFVVLENVPFRVLYHGENALEIWNPNRPPRRRRPQPNEQPDRNNQDQNNPAVAARNAMLHANNNNEAFDWRQTFLGGRIAVPNAETNVIVKTAQDILYIVASFVFSIFPMWDPQAMERQRPQQDDNNNGGGDDNDNGDNAREGEVHG